MSAEEKLKSEKLDKSAWGKRIIAAEERGRFSTSDYVDANSWVTCACGELNKKLVHHNTDSTIYPKWIPRDWELRKLGTDFSRKVSADNFLFAAYDLVDIESRAAYLLARLDK